MSSDNDTGKLWGGRFTESTDKILNELNKSLPIDRRLYNEDIDSSKAYAESLCECKILSVDELSKIENGLEIVRSKWISDDIEFQNNDEDVHTVNERLLTEIIGSIAGKLHTGRSRNDQVATDCLMWIRKSINTLINEVLLTIGVIINKSIDNIDILMPGYTHLQRAQPIRFSHWLLSYAFSLQADCNRFIDLKKRVNTLPLGSGALAGNPFNINRSNLAEKLSFDNVTGNSMFAVSDRDNIVEFNFVMSLMSIHLSRLCEDLILYSTKEFGFLTLTDAFTTGSSLMPQKRNPDSLELVRGITGDIFGRHCGFMMTMKGLPSTYNKDMQFDKVSIFSNYDQIMIALKIVTGVVETMNINAEQCTKALSHDMLATDLAYYLVRKNVPFRKAHHLTGEVVALSEKMNVPLSELSIKSLQTISPLFDNSVKTIWKFENSVEQYSTIGGTAKSSIHDQIMKLNNFIEDVKSKF